MTNDNNNGMTDEMPQRAVSLYGANDGVEDFPVLKAFQQYIDAEQDKARKRIIWLGIFFGAILVVVVAVFLFLLHNINVRNQNLSDRLVEYAMKESERRQSPPAVIQQPQPAQNSEVLKSMTETLVALQKKIEADNAAKASAPTTPAMDDKLNAAVEKLNREKASIELEKKRLEEERERLRQIEIDRQRRKLYPELYEERHSPSRSKVRMLTDDDIREIIKEAYPEAEPTTATDDNARSNKKQPAVLDTVDENEAIDYFKDDDYNIPVDVKGASSKINFTVPIN